MEKMKTDILVCGFINSAFSLAVTPGRFIIRNQVPQSV